MKRALTFVLLVLIGCSMNPEKITSSAPNLERKVYDGKAAGSPHSVSVSEVDLADLPEVSVLVSDGSMPVYFHPLPFDSLRCCLGDGEVRLLNCGGLDYLIVVVK